MKSTHLSTAVTVIAVAVGTVLAAQSAQGQTYKVLYSFTSRSDGANPSAGVIEDAKGNLYGTTSTGDLYGLGTVFKLSQTGKETVLHRFMRKDNGAVPVGGVIMDAEGNLYGTTGFGDYDRDGTVFKLSQTGKATVLHRFFGRNDGSNPYGGLVQDEKGNIYGTTYDGGSYDYGTVFKLSREEKGKWQETVLHTFKGGADGAEPSAGLIRDAEGNFYGTTVSGGGGGQCWHYAIGCGTVFKLDTTGKEIVLYSFTGGDDGNYPMAALIRDTEGNLYGTTYVGGGGSCDFFQTGCGTIFKVSKTGRETVLYRFTGGSDGAAPLSGLVRDVEGNLYGTTEYGGSSLCDCGVVFRLSKTGDLTVLHIFSGVPDGAFPEAGLIRDAEGNLYGTTYYGGDSSCQSGRPGCGVVFKLTP